MKIKKLGIEWKEDLANKSIRISPPSDFYDLKNIMDSLKRLCREFLVTHDKDLTKIYPYSAYYLFESEPYYNKIPIMCILRKGK
jgi:hypothetical protein